jgi:uncharacterized protein YrrD
MDTQIQFRKHATVLSADGKNVGSLVRLVVNPNTKVLTDIVVRTGALLTQTEKVVPIGMVAETNEGQIVLRDEAEDLEFLPAFEETRLGGENEEFPSEDPSPVIVGYPSSGMPAVSPRMEQNLAHVEQNIPDGTVAMKEGAQVITAEGKHIGNVERVLVDPSVDQVTHLLVSRGLLTKETKLIPMKWVMMIGEDKVHLRVKKDTVENLDATPLAG